MPSIDVEMNKGKVAIDGRVILTVSTSVENGERQFVIDLLSTAYRSRKGGLIPHIVPVYDKGEARVVDNFLKKYRSSK